VIPALGSRATPAANPTSEARRDFARAEIQPRSSGSTPNIGWPSAWYTAIALPILERLDLDRVYPRYGFPNDLLVHLNVWNARVRDFPSRPIYGVGERSGIRIRKVVPRISWLLVKGFFWRMREKYVIRDFHPLVFFYLLGLLMTSVGLGLGISEAILRFLDLHRQLAASAVHRATTEVMYEFSESSGLLGLLAAADSPEAIEQAQNLNKLFRIAARIGPLLQRDRVDQFIGHLDLLIEAGGRFRRQAR